MDTCAHCGALTDYVDYCDECDEPACPNCLEMASECPLAPQRRLEEIEDFLADSDDITLAALKELAMEHTRRKLLADAATKPLDAPGVYDGSRAADLLLEVTTDMGTLREMKEGAREVAMEEREKLLARLRDLETREWP